MISLFTTGADRVAMVGCLSLLLVTSRASAQGDMAGMAGMPGMSMTKLMAPNPLGVSMERAGSGTTWVPDAVKLPSLHRMVGEWDFMMHGFVFAEYIDQHGPRGDTQLGSLNWGMFMATRQLAGGRFQARTMLSLDPWSVTPRGYPLLLQSGESYKGVALHDRQHPHDFFMELGATYERAMSTDAGFSLYAGPSGEPALGPVAFMHRPSAMDNPFAPISHHWQDATHIAYGVATAGLFGNKWKVEGSIFNGREPDDQRWNFDPIKLDSYSGRVTLNPSAHWSGTVGYGFMKSPEILDPDAPMHRLTASVMHGAKIGSTGQVATTFVYGGNTHDGHLSNGFLLESEAVLSRSHTVFGRAELVEKAAGDLALEVPPTGFAADREFRVGALSLGYVFDFARFGKATLGLGGMSTINKVPKDIAMAYGDSPMGMTIFLRLRPAFQVVAAPNEAHAHH